MDKFIEWLTQKFSHPLSLLFFLLGVILLLLGLTTGFEIPLLKQLAPAVEYQGISLTLGILCMLLSILIYYKPPQKKYLNDNSTREQTIARIPDSFFARKQIISRTQLGLLEYIERESPVVLNSIQNKYKNIGDKELFYRLEQLRLLGFIENDIFGQSTNTSNTQIYRLSGEYREEIAKTLGNHSRRPSSRARRPAETPKQKRSK